ncbi:MAG: PASTA domain-containing protein [Ruminococcaceae bacterium]|nr:PASTA domain-containing protein [Oscillospiraceae bacterium]
MRYGIKRIKAVKKQKRRVSLRAKRKQVTAICPFNAVQEYNCTRERIRFDDLFAIGELPDKRQRKARQQRKRRKVYDAKKAAAAFSARANRLRRKLLSLGEKKADDKKWLSFLSGALCGTLCVGVVCALAVLALLFGGFLMPYDRLTVPSLIGESYETAASSIDQRFEVELTYKSSDDAAVGEIISQSPSAGTVRKHYKGDGKCKLSLTLSTGKHSYTVTELSGSSARDAILHLRNEGVAIDTLYEYSTAVPSGTVISTSPRAGETVFDGETLVLRISLGKQKILASVPDLFSLTEAAARELLASRGLVLGDITYKASSESAGSIISQQYSPYSKIEKGSRVDVSISLGDGYSQKSAPDLYGLSVDEARAKLAEYGLVLGSVFSVSSGAPKGTVVAQTPIANTPLTSAITSIDIFISS